MTLPPSRIISKDESDFIYFQLLQNTESGEVKAGLQRLCAHYDHGRRLADPHKHRLVVRAHLLDVSIIIRRWAYKAIARIGNRDDVATLISRMKEEGDIENQTWAMAATITLSRDRQVRQICLETGLQEDLPFILAARLFAHERWLRSNNPPNSINIERAAPLTLKWASLLAGYGRAPPNLFHPHFENRILLGKLNSHSTPEVSEYSVWALWQHPGYQVDDLGIGLDSIERHPENVRRWINRLLTKGPEFFAGELDLFDDLRHDRGMKAREGLALGLRELFVPEIDKHVLDWHDNESEEAVRDLLLEHMAYNADASADYGDIVEQYYQGAGPGSGVRKRLLSASARKPLYSSLRRIEIREQSANTDQIPMEGTTPTLIVGSVNVNNTNINAGRDITSQNLVVGKMIESANSAVQKIHASRTQEQATLTEILKFLASANELGIEQRNNVAKAVESVANDGTPAAKRGLLDALRTMSAGAGLVASTTEQLSKFAAIVSTWI